MHLLEISNCFFHYLSPPREPLSGVDSATRAMLVDSGLGFGFGYS